MHAAAPTVYEMMREIVDGDVDQLDRIWASWPNLAIRPIEVGATRGARTTSWTASATTCTPATPPSTSQRQAIAPKSSTRCFSWVRT